jgi:hypothetical protein
MMNVARGMALVVSGGFPISEFAGWLPVVGRRKDCVHPGAGTADLLVAPYSISC